MNTRMKLMDIGLLIIRLGIGLIFIYHGYQKLIAGAEKWEFLGSQAAMLPPFTLLPQIFAAYPKVWGLVAALIEFLGGVLLVIGFGVHVIATILAIFMGVALTYHINNGDAWTAISHPLSLLVVFIGLMIAGAGRYSIDYAIKYRDMNN